MLRPNYVSPKNKVKILKSQLKCFCLIDATSVLYKYIYVCIEKT